MNSQKIRYPTHMTTKPMTMFFAELTDENPVTNAFSTLENIYPNIMGLEYVNRKKSIEMTPEMYGKQRARAILNFFGFL